MEQINWTDEEFELYKLCPVTTYTIKDRNAGTKGYGKTRHTRNGLSLEARYKLK